MHWVLWGSWRFCRLCGRVRPDSRLTSLTTPTVHSVDAECSSKVNNRGSCGRDPASIKYACFEDRGRRVAEDKAVTQECYVTPQRHHWPVYDEGLDVFVMAEAGDTRPSMLDLCPDDARALQIVDLHVKKAKQYGMKSKAPIGNWKKLSLMRCRWRMEDVETGLRSSQARAAFRWFQETHPVYQDHFALHDVRHMRVGRVQHRQTP